jgi:hypothetical protein
VPYAKFGDPQTLNLYAYAENGPLNRIDADGHCPECITWDEAQGENAGQGCTQGQGTGCQAATQAANNQAATGSAGQQAQNTVTFSDTKTTHSYDEKTNTETTTAVTTSVTLSTAKGHEGDFVSAGVTTSTHTKNYETGEKSDQTTTTALDFGQATRAAGGAENMARIRDAVTPGLGSHFASITAQDARAHPYKYAGAAASAAISVIDPPATIGAAVRALVPAVLGLLDSTTGP